MNARPRFISLLLALAIGGCAQHVNAPDVDVPYDPGGVPFAGTRLVLEAHLNRDFMPILPPEDANGRPLLAVLHVRTADGAPLPAGLTLGWAVVTFGDKLWLSQPEVVPTNDPTLLAGRAVNGPKWGPGVTADVKVTVKQGDESMTVRAPGVLITSTH
jgi:hypothetical protein